MTCMAFYRRLYNYVASNEGVRTDVYLDTKGIPTIGIGFNLTRADARYQLYRVGAVHGDILSGKSTLTLRQIKKLTKLDLRIAVADARALCPSFDKLSQSRKIALADMAFNLGRVRLGKFKRMLKAVDEGRWPAARQEVRNSLYHAQVTNRAERNIELFRDY